MADAITTKKVTDLTENTALADSDLFMVGNAGTAALRKLKWSTILAAIKAKLGIGNAAELKTAAKDIVGAVNELNTKFTDMKKTTLLVQKITPTKVGTEWEYTSVPGLNTYDRIYADICIGDGSRELLTVDRAFGSYGAIYSSNVSASFNARIRVHVDFENNRVGIVLNSVTGWNINQLFVANIKGCKF